MTVDRDRDEAEVENGETTGSQTRDPTTDPTSDPEDADEGDLHVEDDSHVGHETRSNASDPLTHESGLDASSDDMAASADARDGGSWGLGDPVESVDDVVDSSDEGDPTESAHELSAARPSDESERRFGLACYPIERVVVLFGTFTAPAIAAVSILRLGQSANGDWSLREVFAYSPSARPLAILTALVGLIALAFGPIYLQYRACSSLTVNSRGFHFQRVAFLPFSLLARDVSASWTSVERAGFEYRRRMGFRTPEVALRWPGGRLNLALTDLREMGQGKSPLTPVKPDEGWQNHPLVLLVETHWKAGLKGRLESAVRDRDG